MLSQFIGKSKPCNPCADNNDLILLIWGMPYQEGRRILRKAQNHAGDQDSYGEVRLDDLDRFHSAPEEGAQVGLEEN